MFLVWEPKLRRICSADYLDRVVHYAVSDLLVPLSSIAWSPTHSLAEGGRGSVRGVQELVRKRPHAPDERGHRYNLQLRVARLGSIRFE